MGAAVVAAVWVAAALDPRAVPLDGYPTLIGMGLLLQLVKPRSFRALLDAPCPVRRLLRMQASSRDAADEPPATTAVRVATRCAPARLRGAWRRAPFPCPPRVLPETPDGPAFRALVMAARLLLTVLCACALCVSALVIGLLAVPVALLVALTPARYTR